MATSPPISIPTNPAPSPPTTTSTTTTSSTSTSTAAPPTTTTSTSSANAPPPTTSTSSRTSLAATTNTPVAPTTTTRLSTASTTSPAILTQTSTRFISSIDGSQPTNNADTRSSSKGFFSNTGAVAGVFSVVGLVGLALIIALITNGIRRRRARKFDKELAAATLEAASAPKPVFLDDDDDDPYRNGGGAGSIGYNNPGGYGAGAVFSDASSHGTFSQPPMSVNSHGGEAYGMREMSGVGPGEIYEPYGGGAAGAAGIGVARARSMRADGGYAAGLQDGAAPYAAFAVPAQKHDPYASQLRGVGRDTNTDILEAAGMGAHVAGAGMLARGQSQYKNAYNSAYQQYPSQAQPQYGGLHQRSPSQLQQAQQLEYANLNRGKSMGSSQGHGAADSYQSHNYTQGAQQNPPYPVPEEDTDDAYGGYVADGHQGGVAVGGAPAVATAVSAKRQSSLPNPFEAGSSTSHGKQGSDDRESRYSDEEEEAPKRVLKIANE